MGRLFQNLLSIGFLQECTPEFIALSRMDKHQLPVFYRQSVIYHHVDPFAELPELQHRAIIKNSIYLNCLPGRQERVEDGRILKYLKVEDSSIVVLEGLPMWDNPMKKLLIQGERADGCQEPAVT